MPFNPATVLIGGVIGWVIRGKGAQPEPVDVSSAIEDLRARKPKTYDVLTIDMSVARANQEVACVGDWLAIKNINSTVDLEVRLNETERDVLNLSRLRTIKQLYYRLFLTNTAGAGSVQLFCSLGGEFYPPDATQIDITSDPVIISGTFAGRPTASLNNRLFWATDVQILYRDTGSEWLAMLSTVISGTLASRPAAATLDRFFWATDENILYHDTGSAWEKAAVADHADLDGVTTDDHHNEGHTLASHSARAHSDLTSIVSGDHHGDNGHHGTILTGTLASRPAAATLDRFFWATDENILYHDTGSAWEKAAVADHADLDGVTTDDHHNEGHTLASHSARAHSDLTGVTSDLHHAQLHAAAHQPGGGDAMAVDAATGTGSLRTIGGGAQQSASGNHSHGATTQQIFIPGTAGDSISSSPNPYRSRRGGYAVVVFRDSHETTWTMAGFFPYVPSSVKLVVWSEVAGDVRIAIASDFGAVGEDVNANTDSIAEASYTLSSDIFAEIDVTAAFTNAAAGDYFGIEITRDGSDVNDTTNERLQFLGILITP